jgi:hypothetical protein
MSDNEVASHGQGAAAPFSGKVNPRRGSGQDDAYFDLALDFIQEHPAGTELPLKSLTISLSGTGRRKNDVTVQRPSHYGKLAVKTCLDAYVDSADLSDLMKRLKSEQKEARLLEAVLRIRRSRFS